jgi:outer membrane receptor protein involved in Fe transport
MDSAYADTNEWNLNYSVGVRNETTERLAWRAAVYAAFRAPTLNEQYKPGREPGNIVIESNAYLVPERLLGGEIGADYAVGSSVMVRATGFWTRVDDPIIEATVAQAGTTGRNIAPCGFIAAGGVCRLRRNLGELRSVGLETEIELHPHANWSFGASYTFNPVEIAETPTDPAIEGNSPRGMPDHAATLTAGFAHPSLLDLNVAGRYVGKRFDDDLNTLELGSFVVLDARAARRVRHDVELFVGVDNLLDHEYEVTRASSGLVRIGGPRTLVGGARVRL